MKVGKGNKELYAENKNDMYLTCRPTISYSDGEESGPDEGGGQKRVVVVIEEQHGYPGGRRNIDNPLSG